MYYIFQNISRCLKKVLVVNKEYRKPFHMPICPFYKISVRPNHIPTDQIVYNSQFILEKSLKRLVQKYSHSAFFIHLQDLIHHLVTCQTLNIIIIFLGHSC